MIHTSVLLQEAIGGLDIQKGNIFVDGTLGNGGHTEEVLRRFASSVKIFAIDEDADAIARSQNRLKGFQSDITYLLGNFRNMTELLGNGGVASVDRILLDIGLSSNQLEESGRGFSFRQDEPLQMTFKTDPGETDLTAEKIVNNWDLESIETIIRYYGEERFAGRIARAIVRTRELTPIKTTGELVETILSATPKFYHRQRLHPATRTFQAIRIAVNDELRALSEGIEKGFNLLNPSGRLAVISFHSLEDRIVKQFFKKLVSEQSGEEITKKPIIPTEEEIIANPRSRSAKLRIIQKI